MSQKTIERKTLLEQVERNGKVEKYSPLHFDGNRGFFLRRQAEGFTEVAFGHGPYLSWLNGRRVAGILACFGPEDTVATLGAFGWQDPNGRTRTHHAEQVFTKKQFESFVEKYRIDLGSKEDITELLSKWTEPDGTENSVPKIEEVQPWQCRESQRRESMADRLRSLLHR